MFLLYLDDAGSLDASGEKHFVLAGIAVSAGQAFRLQDSLERLVGSLGHTSPASLEIHANEILGGRGRWRRMPREERRAFISSGLKAVEGLAGGQWSLFGAVVDKEALFAQNPVEYAFEQVAGRFNQFLQRQDHREDRQIGLILMDNSPHETRLQSFASELRNPGRRWGTMTNLADVPFFVDSKATRGIQYADLVAYALWRKYERGDGEFFDGIANWFDSEGGVVHGLHHYRNRNDFCECPACFSPHQHSG